MLCHKKGERSKGSVMSRTCVKHKTIVCLDGIKKQTHPCSVGEGEKSNGHG